MEIPIFSGWSDLFTGLFAGVVFGFLLQKGSVTRFSTIVNQLLLHDFTVMKVMLTAIAVGGSMIYGLQYLGSDVELNISSTTLFSSLFGGAVFGVGMVVMGYCPGTGVAALADGAKDMWFGFIGMIVGAALYAELFPLIQNTLKPASQLVKTTLPEYFGVSPWVFLILVWSAVVILVFLDRKAASVKSGEVMA